MLHEAADDIKLGRSKLGRPSGQDYPRKGLYRVWSDEDDGDMGHRATDQETLAANNGAHPNDSVRVPGVRDCSGACR